MKKLRYKIVMVAGLILLIPGLNVYAQNLTSSTWTGWVRIAQKGCIQRAKVSLGLANLRLAKNWKWNVTGTANRRHVTIKCVSDNNTSALVNPRTVRMLVDIEVAGLASEIER
jgi:hypothetical protein